MTNYTTINRDNHNEVIWLQLALARLIKHPGAALVHVGTYDPMTTKALEFYQRLRELPVTGEPDETTLQKINQELQARGITL